MSINPYQAYKKTQVATASPGELLLLLFDGAIRFANQAKHFIEKKDLAAAHDKLCRAQDIVAELMFSLDRDVGEIADNLYQLYDYIFNRLVEANVSKDISIVDECIHFLTDLRDTWRQVVDNVK
ncbi:MAG: flagellar export chaperone FliS [Firmicutes bacterium]|nr:flagellar export chaperone FliS [Bacillota bacterium]